MALIEYVGTGYVFGLIGMKEMHAERIPIRKFECAVSPSTGY
jgi:hypothetical protein